MLTDSPKYPRTFHLTFSPGRSDDRTDKILDKDDYFLNKEVIITSKMDGSNVTLSQRDCFARSHAGPPKHASFNLLKQIHSNIKLFIPENICLYCEYIFARHSITYTALPNYLLIFNILDIVTDQWLSWDDVEKFSKIINIPTVPILFKGIIKKQSELEKICLSLMKEKEFGIDDREGIVIRIANSFSNIDFSTCVAKAPRVNHVQTSEHWKNQEIIKNGLASNIDVSNRTKDN